MIIKGAELLPPAYAAASDRIRQAHVDAEGKEANHVEAARRHSEVRAEFLSCVADHDREVEAARKTMMAKPEYTEAVNGLNEKQGEKAKLDSHGRLLGSQLVAIKARANESRLYRMVSGSRRGEEGYQAGHFIVAAWDIVADRLKKTNWFRSADAPRASTEALLRDVRAKQSAASEALMGHKVTIDRLDTEMQRQVRFSLDEVARQRARLAATRSAESGAAKTLHEARMRAEATKKFTNDSTLRSVTGLAELFRADPPTAERKQAFKSFRSLPDGKTKGAQVTEAVRSLTLLAPAIEGYTAEIDEAKKLLEKLESASRGMRYKRLNQSGRNIKVADAYMSSRASDDLFDPGSLAIVMSMADDMMDGGMGMGSTLESSFGSSFGSSGGFDM
jgi:hypothetical protein